MNWMWCHPAHACKAIYSFLYLYINEINKSPVMNINITSINVIRSFVGPYDLLRMWDSAAVLLMVPGPELSKLGTIPSETRSSVSRFKGLLVGPRCPLGCGFCVFKKQ